VNCRTTSLRLGVLTAMSFITCIAAAQERVNVGRRLKCSYTIGVIGDLIIDSPRPSEIEIVKGILRTAGLEPNFKVGSSKHPAVNAAAYYERENRIRWIFYNPSFLDQVARLNPAWAVKSILAHELGHHLQGHTVQPEDTTLAESHRDELEADSYSGFLLQKMGASLAQAQATMRALAPGFDTASHPRLEDRLRAIAEGYEDGGGASPNDPGSNTNGFCGGLRALVSEMPNGFESVLVPGAGSGAVNKLRPDMSGVRCTVKRAGSSKAYYVCLNPFFDDQAAARRSFESIVDKVQGCLGEPWSRAGARNAGSSWRNWRDDLAVRFARENAVVIVSGLFRTNVNHVQLFVIRSDLESSLYGMPGPWR